MLVYGTILIHMYMPPSLYIQVYAIFDRVLEILSLQSTEGGVMPNPYADILSSIFEQLMEYDWAIRGKFVFLTALSKR